MQREIDSTPDSGTFTPVDVAVLRYRRNRPADVVMPGRVDEDATSHIAFYTIQCSELSSRDRRPPVGRN